MKQKKWFRPKLFGWGFVPVSWEGWLATLVLIGICLLSAYANGFFSALGPTSMQAANYLFDLCIIIAVFSLIALPKTEGELKWNWGKRR